MEDSKKVKKAKNSLNKANEIITTKTELSANIENVIASLNLKILQSKKMLKSYLNASKQLKYSRIVFSIPVIGVAILAYLTNAIYKMSSFSQTTIFSAGFTLVIAAAFAIGYHNETKDIKKLLKEVNFDDEISKMLEDTAKQVELSHELAKTKEEIELAKQTKLKMLKAIVKEYEAEVEIKEMSKTNLLDISDPKLDDEVAEDEKGLGHRLVYNNRK